MNKLICLGDSTMQFNDESTYPQVGWIQGLNGYFKDELKILNFAKNGRSTKTFLKLGDFDNAIKEIDDKSIVLIQFGHNDGHDYDAERYTTAKEYRKNLDIMIDECQKRGAYILLLTSIYRRHFNNGVIEEGCHKVYQEEMLSLAKKRHIDIIDMTSITYNWLKRIGDDASKEYFMQLEKGKYPNYPDGLDDNTHLVQKGADAIAGMFIDNIKDKEIFKGLLK